MRSHILWQIAKWPSDQIKSSLKGKIKRMAPYSSFRETVIVIEGLYLHDVFDNSCICPRTNGILKTSKPLVWCALVGTGASIGTGEGVHTSTLVSLILVRLNIQKRLN